MLDNVLAVSEEQTFKHNDSTRPFKVIPLIEKLMLFTKILSL